MRRTAALLFAGSMVAAMLVAPVSAQAKTYTPQTETLSIKTEYGHLYIEVTYPTNNGKPVKGPAVVTLSPYSVLGRSNVSMDWVPEGYVHVWADVIGTGNSGGCYDYGGERERRTGYELVEWIAKQPWSNGKVAMIGGSYNGTTAWATAAEAPPHLTTIVPQAAIARWYDYAFAGGVRYFLNNESPSDEGVDTPLGFDFGFAIPPPVDVQDPAWADKVASTITPCDEVAHSQHGYDDTPDYDAFWKERDYLKDAKDIDIPVLISHNWGDWNVKPDGAFWMYNALKKYSSAKTTLYMGTRWDGHGTPAGEAYAETVKQWFDHYLMGKNNGADKIPSYITALADYDGTIEGDFKGEPKVRNIKLIAQESPFPLNDNKWLLLPSKYREFFGVEGTRAMWPADAPNAETHANHHARQNHEWWYFESPALKKDTRVFGEAKVQVYSKVARTWVTLAPVVLDVKHECHKTYANQHITTPECTTQPAPSAAVTPRAVVSVTRGFLDTRYREGLHKQVLAEPDKSFLSTVTMKPTDYLFRKGHSIAVNFFTNNAEWMVQKYPLPTDLSVDCPPEKVMDAINNTSPTSVAGVADCMKFELDWMTNKVRIVIPVVNGPSDANDLFDYDHKHGTEECDPPQLPICP